MQEQVLKNGRNFTEGEIPITLLSEWQKEISNAPIQVIPSKKLCLEIASKVPCTCLQELFDNAEKISRYLTETF